MYKIAARTAFISLKFIFELAATFAFKNHFIPFKNKYGDANNQKVLTKYNAKR